MKLQNIYINEAILVNGQKFTDEIKALRHILETHLDPNKLVVTYTAINKVGINPSSRYATPVGIYFYPLKYVVDNEGEVPFAGDQKYLNVCEIVDMSKILTMTKFEDYHNHQGLELLARNFKDANIAINIVLSSTKHQVHQVRSNYSVLWLAARQIAFGNPVQWNTVFRKIGIDGFIDYETGTIHPNEPTQGVVFKKESLKVLHVIHRSRHLRGIDLRKEPNRISEIQSPTERQQLILVRSRPDYIEHILKPSKSVQMVAVTRDPYAVTRINNPDNDVITKAVLEVPHLLYSFNIDKIIELLKSTKGKIIFDSINEDIICQIFKQLREYDYGKGKELVRLLGDKISEEVVHNLLLQVGNEYGYNKNAVGMADMLGDNLHKLSRQSIVDLLRRNPVTKAIFPNIETEPKRKRNDDLWKVLQT